MTSVGASSHHGFHGLHGSLCRDHDILGHRVAVSSCIGEIGVDLEPLALGGSVDPGANVTDRPPGTLPDGRCRDERRGGESDDDDRAHGDDPSGPDERSRASTEPTQRSDAGHGRAEVDRRQSEPTGAGGAPESRAFDGVISTVGSRSPDSELTIWSRSISGKWSSGRRTSLTGSSGI